jgi:hypothetical protein
MRLASIVPMSARWNDRSIYAWPVRSGGGAGIHLLFRWDNPEKASDVRLLMKEILTAVQLRPGSGGIAKGEVEIFPKADVVKRFGALIAIPFGRQSVALDGEMESADTIPAWISSESVRPAGPKLSTAPPHHALILAALRYIPSDDYQRWITCGLALKDELASISGTADRMSLPLWKATKTSAPPARKSVRAMRYLACG